MESFYEKYKKTRKKNRPLDDDELEQLEKENLILGSREMNVGTPPTENSGSQ